MAFENVCPGIDKSLLLRDVMVEGDLVDRKSGELTKVLFGLPPCLPGAWVFGDCGKVTTGIPSDSAIVHGSKCRKKWLVSLSFFDFGSFEVKALSPLCKTADDPTIFTILIPYVLYEKVTYD